MNHLKSLNQLNNHYFALRHGESTANHQGLIVSSPDNGIKDYGLSETGKKQINDSVKACNKINKVTKIISSDFLRAFESSNIAQHLLHSETDIQISKYLRERFFGDHELHNNTFYQNVWDNDEIDPSHTINNVESADAVMARTTSLVTSLERDFKGDTFLLVSHGDAIQILQTAFNKLPASLHRSLSHLNTAEIRELTLTP